MTPVLQAQRVDITTLEVDAIVNAANSALLAGGGVCGAIHDKAGPELEDACRLLAPCPTGEARITPGFRLPARFVIHAVGPIWHGGQHREQEDLASAYASCIRLAKANDLSSIAFPAISTGIYGYPLALAAETAVGAVRAALIHPGSLTRVIFACFSPEALEAYRQAGVAG